MKILGFEHVKFNFPDGRDCEGTYVYLHDDLYTKCEGLKTERVFLSDAKANACGFKPKLGDKVKVLYNRYGKVDEIQTIRV